ncbi:MAG: PepSY domain-containing protein [Pseudomonadota bacterium]
MRSLKQDAAKIHLWFGLSIGLVGVYMAITGAWILFRPQADALVNPSYLSIRAACEKPVSLDTILTSAERAYRKAPVDSIAWQRDPLASTMVRYTDDQQSYFDPCTGILLGFHSRWSGSFGFVEMLHRFRFLPVHVAETMAGAFAIVMAFAMALLGLFIWWPRRRAAWKPSLTIDNRLEGRARTRNRHAVIGAFASLGLLLIAGSGIVLAFDPVEQFLFTVTRSEKIHKPDLDAITPGGPVALEAAWSNALSLMPAMPRAASLRLPTPKRASIEMYVYDEGNPNPEGRTYVYADAATGRIARYLPYAQTPRGQRLYSWFVALHEGEVGGLVGQLLTFLTMIAVVYLGYSGVRSFVQKRMANAPPLRLKVAAIRSEALGVKAFDLVPSGRTRIRPFTAGAHIEVHVPGGPRRQYSLCNGPAQRDSYTIAVRLEESSRGGSKGMHALQVGQEVLVKRPKNHFPIDRATRHATLVAAGIGITPMLSMARHLLARKTPFTLHYFGRDAESMPYTRVFALQEFAPHSHIHIGLGRAAIPAILADVLARRPEGGHVYTCGPDAFMDAVADAACGANWPRQSIHRENFAPAAALRGSPRDAFEVMLARSGRKVVVSREETMLQALFAADIHVASSCEQGTCGECALHVVDGEIDHRDCFLSDSERALGNVILGCVSRAKGRALVIDA